MRDLRIGAVFEPFEQSSGVVPLLSGEIDLRQVEKILLAARTELDRHLDRLGRRMNAAALESRHGKHVVGLGEVGLFIDHEDQVLNHVGNALNRLLARLRGAKFHQRQIVVCPGIAAIEFRGLGQFLVGLIEFLSLHAHPGQGAVRDHIVRLGIGDDRLEIFLALIAMFGQAHRHFRHQRLRLRLRYILDAASDVERPERSRELAYLAAAPDGPLRVGL